MAIVFVLLTNCALKQNRSELETDHVHDYNQHYYCQTNFDSISKSTYLSMWFDHHHKLKFFHTNHSPLRKIKVSEDVMEESGSSVDIDDEQPIEKEDLALELSVPPNEVNINISNTYEFEKIFANDLENPPITLNYRLTTLGTECKQTRVLKLDNWRNQYQPSGSAILLMEGCTPSDQTVIIDGEKSDIVVSKAKQAFFRCRIHQSDIIPESFETKLKASQLKLTEINDDTLTKNIQEGLPEKSLKIKDELSEYIKADFKKSKKLQSSKILYDSNDVVQILQQYQYELGSENPLILEYLNRGNEIDAFVNQNEKRTLLCSLRYKKVNDRDIYQNQPTFSKCYFNFNDFK